MELLKTAPFLCLLAGHLVGDHYWKGRGEQNEGRRRRETRHAVRYAAAMLAVWLPWHDCAVWWAALVPAGVHAAGHGAWAWLGRNRPGLKIAHGFAVGQAACVVLLACCAFGVQAAPQWSAWGIRLADALRALAAPCTPRQLLAAGVLVLLLARPANTLLKRCNRRPPDAAQPETGCQNAGAIIGTLERLLIAMLCLMEQYAAIGLVLAAKTLTRYDKISHEKEFAEYYLIGTLGSLLFALCATKLLLG